LRAAAAFVIAFVLSVTDGRADDGEPPPAAAPSAATGTPERRPVPKRPEKPRPLPPAEPIPVTRTPTGFTRIGPGPSSYPGSEFVPIPDRWRIGWPEYDRYPNAPHEAVQVRGHWWDPYKQNVLKGDYAICPRGRLEPFCDQNTFFVFTLRNDTLVEGRRLPVPSDVSSARPQSQEFFGKGESLTVEDNVLMSFELFHGNAGFRPREWELRATPVFNANYLAARENGVVNIDPRRGTDRFDGHVAFQELFGDYELGVLSPNFDTLNLRVGIQPFTSDFRGFVFTDAAPGVKLSGNYYANRLQWNLAYFRPLDKDTNTGLNTLFRDREQDVAIANATLQDAGWPGYFTQLSLQYSHDHPSTLHFDENGFLVRPAAVGDAAPHDIRVGYAGWTGDGHIGRMNVDHAFFQAVGYDTRNPIAGRGVDINAQMAALELSYDRDWLRWKASFFWASGDSDPTDGTATGFDAITDNPFFVGGSGSFWQRQGIKLTGTNVNLVNRFSLLPTLRSSKDEGQANFVNPGIFIYNVGVAGRLTPKLSFDANVSYLRFQEPASLQHVLLQRRLPHDVGLDTGIVFKYRPLLIDNVIVVAGAAAFTPLAGFRAIYTSEVLFQAFAALTLTY
jgi:hypothetical protein